MFFCPGSISAVGRNSPEIAKGIHCKLENDLYFRERERERERERVGDRDRERGGRREREKEKE
jgi:hypothetical protein